MHSLVFGFGLALVLGGCGGDLADTTPDPNGLVEGQAGDAGADADGDAANSQASDANSDEGSAEPFHGPCDATGKWKLTYAAIVEDECGIPSLEDEIAISPGAALPVSLVNASVLPEMKSASVENEGCTIKAYWGWLQWLGGVPNEGETEGEDSHLTLTLTSATTATGTLTFGKHWWCGSYGVRTFHAQAERE